MSEFGPDTKDGIKLPCAHVFDRKCLTSWVSEKAANKNTCPICRHVLFEQKSDNFEDILILSSYDGLHERFEFNRRDEPEEESWSIFGGEAAGELGWLSWFCLGGPFCDDEWDCGLEG